MQVYLTAEFILLKHASWLVMGNENGTQQPESHCVPFFLTGLSIRPNELN